MYFPPLKYRVVCFRYVQVSSEIMELEKETQSLRYSTMEGSTFEGTFVIGIHPHRARSAEELLECAARDLPVLPP